MLKHSKLHTAILLACCSLSAFTHTAYAQEETTAKQAKSNSDDFEVILVSAQKRDQALKEVPSSIEVLSGDLIQEIGIDNGFDLVTYLPGFGIDDSSEIRTTTLKTRGIGTFTNSIGLQSSNLVVIDGEVLPRQSMLNLPISDVKRVEAMRGPQGTLFGQNTSTGLLHYVTKKPQLDDRVSGTVRAQVTEFDGTDFSGTVNVPLNENWAARFNAQYSDIDGWIKNTMPGEEDYTIGAKTTKAGRGQLLYDNGQELNVLFRLEYSETDTNCCSLTRLGGINPDFGPRPIVNVKDDGTIEGTTYNRVNPESTFEEAGGPVTSRNAEGNFGRTENFGFSISADYYLNDEVTLSYNGSYRDFDLYNSSAFFTINFPVERTAFGGNESVDVLQQEFRISSFNNERFDWVLGLFYHDTDGQRSEVRDGCIAGNRGFIEGGELTGCYSRQSTDAFLANYAATGDDDRSLLTPSRLLNSGDFTTGFENVAIFGQLEYQITEQLDATFGFRLLHEKSNATFARTDLATPSMGVGMETFNEVLELAQTDPSLILRQDAPTKFDNSDTAFIYKAVVGYDFTDDIRGYVNYSTGYKGASYFVTTNTDPADADNFPTDPENSSNFEVGLRSAYFDNDLLFNFTYFDMRVDDYQVRASRVIDEENNIIFAGYVNAAQARSTGIEADVVVKISDKLKWSFNYAYFDARYEDFADTPINCPADDGGLLASRCTTDSTGRQSFDQTGLSFPNNAEQQFLSTISYNTQIADTGWKANTSAVWRYNGSHTQSINELAFGESANPSSSIWDGYLSVSKDNLQFSVFIKNLFDKSYTTRQRINSEGFGEAFYPRDWSRYVGASVQYSF